MTRPFFLIICLLALILPVQPCYAAGPPKFAATFLAADQNEGISSSEAARIVQRKTGGKVLRVEERGAFYQVRVLLPNGVVKTYSVNRATGAMG